MPTLTPRGPFSLKAAAEFGFGPTEGQAAVYDGAMRLAFALDGGTGYAGATLAQPEPDGPVEVGIQTSDGGDGDAALRQVARIVSLDHDGEEFVKISERDPVIGALQRAHPGQRPVLFHSPYEAVAWAIISARRPATQSAGIRRTMSAEHGATFELGGKTLHAFPQPDRLIDLPLDTPGLNAQKVERLRAAAEASLSGVLDAEHLQRLGPERAYEAVQTLKGIGPFYAGLVVLRASGFADAMLLMVEPKVLSRTAELYSLAEPPTLEQFTAMAERWRPFRTWATVLIRLGGDRAASGSSSGTPSRLRP